MYLATSPDLFPTICAQLGAAGLNGDKVRVVLEKPLGHDLASARRSTASSRSVFREEQAFRIDHYLGKPAVQNLMALRFGNALFEPLWRRESIANIQITLAEAIGVGTRGDFYGRTGALRDMIQNHALQLLTMIAMEPPSRNVADAIRDEKLKVLRSLKPFSAESVAARRGPRPVPRRHDRRQAGARLPRGRQGAGRAAGPRPSSRSRTEVQNWRWAGVPFYLRTGKRLAARDAQIVVNFRPTPHNIFPGVSRPNKLVIKLQPEDGLELHLLAAKGAGQSEALAPVSLDLDFDKAFAENRVGAYERLLLDVDRRAAQPVRAQRRAGAGLALGRADPRRLAARRCRAAALRRRHLGTGRRRARWWRATATPGRKRSSRPGSGRSGQRELLHQSCAPDAGLAGRFAPVRSEQRPTRASDLTCQAISAFAPEILPPPGQRCAVG